MKYYSVADMAKKWNISERSVRNYCAQGRVTGAVLNGKTWSIPENARKPERINKSKKQLITLLDILKQEKDSRYSGGIYHKTQIELTYNSNHMEGSRLTHDQTRYIFETNTIGVSDEGINVDDVIETTNHFRCVDIIIDNAKVMSKGQITLPKEIRVKLGVDTGDRVTLICDGDQEVMMNAAVYAMKMLQNGMLGEAKMSDMVSEEDVNNAVRKIRKEVENL